VSPFARCEAVEGRNTSQLFCFLDFALLITSLLYSSSPHKTAVEILSEPLQNGSLVTPLSDELRVILFASRSTRRVFTMHRYNLVAVPTENVKASKVDASGTKDLNRIGNIAEPKAFVALNLS